MKLDRTWKTEDTQKHTLAIAQEALLLGWDNLPADKKELYAELLFPSTSQACRLCGKRLPPESAVIEGAITYCSTCRALLVDLD